MRFKVFFALVVSSALCASEMTYIAPKQASEARYFEEVREKGNQKDATFSTMVSFLSQIKDNCHQFYFYYPLQGSEHAKTFSKVMQIKAQEAHR